MKYFCECCNFRTNIKCNYISHLNTYKHKNNSDGNITYNDLCYKNRLLENKVDHLTKLDKINQKIIEEKDMHIKFIESELDVYKKIITGKTDNITKTLSMMGCLTRSI